MSFKRFCNVKDIPITIGTQHTLFHQWNMPGGTHWIYPISYIFKLGKAYKL